MSPSTLAAFARVVGEEHARDAAGAADARDPYHPDHGTPREPLPGGLVRPACLDELREVVKIAADTGTALWTVSRGRNFGYGGPAPVESGSVVLDLRRMDRIVDIDPRTPSAIVEPGVTSEMLFAEIRRRELPLWMDGASSPYGSMIATALERGVGYSVLGDRWEALCGLEVLLSDGELLRTGPGALTGSTVWTNNRYGYGPAIDGLFSQSNFGIVTKGGFWLMPEPKSFRHSEVYISDLDEADAFVQALLDLRAAGVIRTAVSGGRNYGGHVAGAKGPGGGRLPRPGERPGLRARLGYLGPRAVIDAQWAETLDALSGLRSFTSASAAYDAPYDFRSWPSEARLAAGIPSPLELPGWEDVHYVTFASVILPNTGEAYGELLRMLDEVLAPFGRRALPPTFHLHSARSMVCLVGVRLLGDPFAQPDQLPASNAQAQEIVRDVIRAAARRGWVEYRAGTPYMDLVADLHDFNGGASSRVLSRLKAALDPAGVLSPGKSGIWPVEPRADASDIPGDDVGSQEPARR